MFNPLAAANPPVCSHGKEVDDTELVRAVLSAYCFGSAQDFVAALKAKYHITHISGMETTPLRGVKRK